MSAASGLPIYDGGPADVIFNWGGGGRSVPRKSVVLNRNPIFNKYSQAKAMFDSGVATPRPYRLIEAVKKFPVVRKPINSYGGHGIRLVRSAKTVNGRYNFWYQDLVNKDREFRVYFFTGEVCMVEEKLVKDKSELTWNLRNCLRWNRYRELEDSKVIEDLVIPAAKSIGIDWGAADVLMDKREKFWICEINSRPSCWGGLKPKLNMKTRNGIYELINNDRSELDLSARMWANRMGAFINNL